MALSAPEPGTVIDAKYRVERVLGRGGMGFVLEATHLALGKRVALKVLRIEAADDQARQRFAREARIAAQLPDEHIAAVSDFGETSAGEPYLVMELLAGSDLERVLAERGPLPVTEAVDVILEACAGVADAHALGLVHRDLKPANLFLVRRRDGTSRVKVLDFGLSKVMAETHENLTTTASTFGTPQYMSPEQIRSAKYVDARTDQHALAMILYELLAGKPPYVAESVTGLYVVISTASPAPLRAHRADVPPGLEAVILRALAKDPADRFPDLAALAAGAGALRWAGSRRVERARRGGAGARGAAPVRAGRSARARGGAAGGAVASGDDGADRRPPRVVAWSPPSPPERAPGPPAWQPAPRPPQDTHAALESDPDRSSSRRTKVALAAFAGVVALLGAAAVTRWVAAGDATSVAPATPTPTATITAAETAATATPPPAAAPDAPAPATTVTVATAESAPAPAKPPPPRAVKAGKKTVDAASDVFGQRRK